MNGFAQRLAAVRRQKGMTQNEVAERLGVSSQAVSLWEHGETSPDIDKLKELASVFQVSVDWLLSENEKEELMIDCRDTLSDRLFDESRMYTYVKTYALAHNLDQTVKVLPYVRTMHEGQFRKGKDRVPYIYHPLLIACHALALGLDEDDLISTALLHDVCEDCGVVPKDLPVNENTRQAVSLMTNQGGKSDEALKPYFEGIASNRIATMVKLLDRCNNVSGMAAAFTQEKMAAYIRETEKWVYPLLRQAKERYPMYSNQLFLIKYHMTSVVETIRHLID